MVTRVSGADRGNAALELVLLAPVILFLVGLVIAAGRTSVAQGAVDAAAREAARQASIAPTASAAVQAALAGAGAALRTDGLDCQPLVFLPGLAAAFATQPGQPAQVHARVVCVVRLSDLVVPGVPGSIRLTSSYTSPLDPYRSRDLAVTAFVTAFVTPGLAQSVTRTSTKGTGCDENKARV
jgi:TadE-like protein